MMFSSPAKRKEQEFDSKSAGVISTIVIMVVFGTLTPTLFPQTYGNVRLFLSAISPPVIAFEL